MVKGNTWESRENLKNTKKLVEEFEREYRKKAEKVKQQKKENKKKEFSRKLPERFTVKILQRWLNKKYEKQRKRR